MSTQIVCLAFAASTLMATATHAAPVTYDFDLDLPKVSPTLEQTGGTYAITGTITTDGRLGILRASDIVNADLNFDGNHLGFYSLSGTALSAAADGKLSFIVPQDLSGGFLSFKNNGESAFLDFSVIYSFSFEYTAIYGGKPDANGLSTYGYDAFSSDTTITLGTTAVSSVPLPASAPMFGAALLAMGTLGYGMKRRQTA